MRLTEDKQGWLASYEELQSLIGLLAINNNPLAIITGQIASSDAKAKEVWNNFEDVQQDLLRTMLTTLVSPTQTIHLAWTIGDFHYQRVTLARQAGQKDFVWLAQQSQGELYQLQKVAGEEINLLLNDILMINSLGDENRSQTLGTSAVLGLLGVTELMRQQYHQSMLNHQAPNNSLSAEQLQTILNAAAQIDFRWPSCFWEKNLPLDITTLAGQIPDVIQELITEGWLKSASSGQFELTENALFMAEEMINDRSKVSITIASTDGQENNASG